MTRGYWQSLQEYSGSISLLLLASISSLIWAIPLLNDYKKWVEIEIPGAFSESRRGYIGSWLLTFILRRERRDPSSIKFEGRGYLKPEDIPVRQYPPPEIARWHIPHRQVSQIAFDLDKDDTPESNVKDFFNDVIQKHRLCFRGKSAVEKGLEAVYFKDSNLKNEIIHRHVKDGSFHVTLHKGDVKTVLEKKWGELHPGYPPFSKQSYEDVVLLYAPQKIEDYEVYKLITEAAVKHYKHSK